VGHPVSPFYLVNSVYLVSPDPVPGAIDREPVSNVSDPYLQHS